MSDDCPKCDRPTATAEDSFDLVLNPDDDDGTDALCWRHWFIGDACDGRSIERRDILRAYADAQAMLEEVAAERGETLRKAGDVAVASRDAALDACAARISALLVQSARRRSAILKMADRIKLLCSTLDEARAANAALREMVPPIEDPAQWTAEERAMLEGFAATCQSPRVAVATQSDDAGEMEDCR